MSKATKSKSKKLLLAKAQQIPVGKVVHLLSVPFTGLGNYQGFRGSRWLKNRIQIFKQFVVPSLQAQTDQDFVLWLAWRHKEKNNQQVKELEEWLRGNTNFKIVFTYSGICFYDDKYEDSVARIRLMDALHGSMGELLNIMGEAETILMTIQPSDDCYNKNMVRGVKTIFAKTDLEAFGFTRGYIMNYKTGELADYNPQTNPPFYTIKFSREVFIDPFKHTQYTSLKKDVGKYKAGTPLPSHEYVQDCLKYGIIKEDRGFLVGTHLSNISTTFDHPYKGQNVSKEVLKDFGLESVGLLKVSFSIRNWLFHKLSYKVKRKLRYWWGEKIYNWIRA